MRLARLGRRLAVRTGRQPSPLETVFLAALFLMALGCLWSGSVPLDSRCGEFAPYAVARLLAEVERTFRQAVTHT
jgi:hypothetical protein